MNLKESFRYHTFLDGNITRLLNYIRNEDNLTRVTELHEKKKTNQDAENEEVDLTKEREYDCQPEDIAYLIKNLIDEKLKLSMEIEKAKESIGLDWVENDKHLSLDAAVEYNKQIRTMTQNLKYLVDLKSKESERQGQDYKFNAEGNQVPYRFPVKVSKTIDYNRVVVKDLYKKLITNADTISTQIDEAMLKDCVKYSPKYDLHDSTADIVEKYLLTK